MSNYFLELKTSELRQKLLLIYETGRCTDIKEIHLKTMTEAKEKMALLLGNNPNNQYEFLDQLTTLREKISQCLVLEKDEQGILLCILQIHRAQFGIRLIEELETKIKECSSDLQNPT